jgi:2-polyprenyl-3-methyl-5-hydroxy-6-metoxy-1,4-benzoquinol methylase
VAKRVREVFSVDDTIVTAIPETAFTDGTSQQRYHRWRLTLDDSNRSALEYLVPRIELDVTRAWPAAMTPRAGVDIDPAALTARVDELGPWGVPFPLGNGSTTMMTDATAAAVAERRFLYRLSLINGAVAMLLGDSLPDTTVLDIGCNFGLFSLDLAGRGAARVTGIDLRPENVARAQFLADHYGIENVSFEVRDADDIPTDTQWDVVLNLGVLYHMLNPFDFIRRTFELCRSFAVIDTVCHTEPVSGYFVMGDKDVNVTAEGRESRELHPTYRAVIDTIRHAGFREIFEVVGRSEIPHQLYASGSRRCLLAMK